MEISNQSLKFHSDGLPENTLLLTRLHGEEVLSGPFRFELELISTDPKVDLDAVLYHPAKVGLLQRLGADQKVFRWFQGALAELEEHEQGQGWVSYRAVLVPDLWRLRENHRSRIYQDTTIDELVGEVLNKGLSFQPGQDFEFKLSRTKPGDRARRPVYPEHEYVVQYEETDLDFVSRWLEHEGVFYAFENDGTREKVVFADSTAAYKPVNAQGSTYLYRPQGRSRSTASEQEGRGDAEEVLAFRCRARRQPGKVRLNDYNWRDPSASLATAKDVHGKAPGLQLEYNDHYKTPEQGKALAEVRAQEWQCRAALYTGESTCRGFRPGRRFDLDEHFRGDWNRAYVLTRVVHEAEQSINLEASNVTAADYKNTFECIPADRDFRPARVTPWPSIRGVIHGKVDAEGEGDYAELDEHGRYKVRLPFDEHEPDAAPGRASRWIRMAQPYAGVDAGFHFPLLKGTEVLITHVDGDPDRPIIAAAVPNPETQSPVRDENRRQNRIRTTSGNVFVLDDNADLSGWVFKDASGKILQDFRQRGARRGGGAGGGGGGEPRPAAPRTTPATPAIPPEAAAALAAARAAAAEAVASAPGAVRATGPAPASAGGPSSLFEQLLRGGNASPAAPRREAGVGGGRGEEGDDGDYTSVEEFIHDNPDVGAMLNIGCRSLEGVGADLSSGYILDAACFDRLVEIAAGTTFSFTWAPAAFSYTENPTSFSVVGVAQTANELIMAAQQTTSTFLGAKEEISMFAGLKHTFSLCLSLEENESITVAGKNDVNIEVGGFNATNIVLAVKNTIDIVGGLEGQLELKLAGTAKVSFVGALDVELNIKVGGGIVVDLVLAANLQLTIGVDAKLEINLVPSKLQVTVPDETEARLTKNELELSRTMTRLNNVQTALGETQTHLAETGTKLADTETKLADTQTKLNETETKLNETGTKLNSTATALNKQITALNKQDQAISRAVVALSHQIT